MMIFRERKSVPEVSGALMNKKQDQLILYSTGCPRCKVLEERMTQLGIEYEVRENLTPIIEAGYQTVPVVWYRNRYFSFGEAMDLIRLIAMEKNEDKHKTG